VLHFYSGQPLQNLSGVDNCDYADSNAAIAAARARFEPMVGIIQKSA
jgi:hypothetical protein